MRSKILIVMLNGVLFAGSAAGQEAQADWRIGLAKVKVTPDEPIRMAGYAARTLPFESVTSDLYAKAMAFEDRDGNRALLITADTLGFPEELSERICKRVMVAAGLERESVLLNGTHTHAGPLVFPRLGYPMGEAEEKRIIQYGKQFEDKVVEITQEALADLRPARLAWGAGVAKFVMNRREFTERGIILGANPRGLADRTAPVLRVEDADGKLRAVLFGAASHCTTLTGQNMSVDGEYAGYAQTYLEKKHPDVQAMFLTGCAGDANPYPRGTLELARQHGEDLGAEVARVLGAKLRPVRGPVRTEFRRVILPLQKFTRGEIESLGEGAPSYRRFFVEGALQMLDRGEKLPESYRAPFALWQFGGDLTLVGFSGETLVDYVSLTEKAIGPLNLWVAGYCNDLFGYLPTSRVLAEGGYETRGLYTTIGLFAPGVEDVVMSAITDMARAAARPIAASRPPSQ
jgi:neutral ceramidase